MLIKSIARILTACSLCFLQIVPPTYASSALPSLGDGSSNSITQQQEYELGQAFLKLIYSQTPTLDDPELINYAESLIYKLAEASELSDHRLSVVIINDPALNAFAAPGGIVGINYGLFNYAKSEQEFAAVLAHELAHLSQRHYARTLDAAKRQELPSAIALLGSIALAAVSGNAGIAALSATMAGMQSQQLRFSRINEQEADNIGIKTLVAAGMDPYAMPSIFERMSRLEAQQQLEFLRTHPVTQNRIADASNRAAQFKKHEYHDHLNYHLMVKRVAILHNKKHGYNSESPSDFKRTLETESSQSVKEYAEALYFFQQQKWQQAEATIAPLTKKYPNNLYISLLNNQILFYSGKSKAAIDELEQLAILYPDNLPVIITMGKLLFENNQYKKSEQVLEQFTHKKPSYPFVWQELADAAGKSNNILQVHRANAEFYFLTGNFGSAIKNLEYALTLARKNKNLQIAIKQRIIEIQEYQAKMQE